MRKDVRTGAIIGGILVGGLVVYAIVVSTGPTKTPNKPPAESPVALDLQGAKAPVAPPSHPEPTIPDDRAGRVPAPAPAHDPSADGGVAAAPVPPTPPALPERPRAAAREPPPGRAAPIGALCSAQPIPKEMSSPSVTHTPRTGHPGRSRADPRRQRCAGDCRNTPLILRRSR